MAPAGRPLRLEGVACPAWEGLGRPLLLLALGLALPADLHLRNRDRPLPELPEVHEKTVGIAVADHHSLLGLVPLRPRPRVPDQAPQGNVLLQLRDLLRVLLPRSCLLRLLFLL